MGSYDDGIYYYFGDKMPMHITFEMWTDDADIETCDLRITSVNQNQSMPYGTLAAPTTNTTTTNTTTNTTTKPTTNTTKVNTTTLAMP